MGNVNIDEAAANADISKMKQAKAKLEESMNSLNKMKSAVSSMSGKTGDAIDVKASALIGLIKDLNSQLDATMNLIRRTVQKYQEEDQRIGSSISSGSGV